MQKFKLQLIFPTLLLCVLAAALARRLIPVFRNIKSERREPQ